MNRLYNELKKVYADAGVVVRTKAPLVFLILSLLAGLLLAVFVFDVIAGDYLNAAIEAVILATMVVSVIMLFRGRYRFASVVPLVVASVAVVGMAALMDMQSPFQTYTAMAYVLPPVLLATAMSDSEWYTVGAGAVGLIAIVGVSFLGIAPTIAGTPEQALLAQRLVPTLGIYLMIVVMAILITSRTTASLRDVEAAATRGSETLAEIAKVNHEARSTLSASQYVANNYEAVSESIQQIREQIGVLHENIGSLEQTATSAHASVTSIADRVSGFHAQVDEQNTVVQESTAAVNEMSASLDSVAQITSSRREASERLLEVAAAGGQALEEAATSFSAASERMNALLEINEIVSDIAAQTNLLSMNAAIEAAHAGDAGRGFAVVAGEIRKLAGTTGENSRVISDSLQQIMKSIAETGGHVESTRNSMGLITTEVRAVSSAFEEITGSTRELSQGGREIMNAMQVLQDTSIRVRDGSDEISRDQRSARDQMGAVSEIVTGMTRAAQEVTTAVASIDESMRHLQETIDRSNLQSLKLQESISSLAGQLNETEEPDSRSRQPVRTPVQSATPEFA